MPNIPKQDVLAEWMNGGMDEAYPDMEFYIESFCLSCEWYLIPTNRDKTYIKIIHNIRVKKGSGQVISMYA